MNLSQRTFALHLALTPGIGGRSVSRILARNSLLDRSPADFLALSAAIYREEYKLTAKAVTALDTDRDTKIRQTLESERRFVALGISWVTVADAHYPANIDTMHPDPPGVLFLYGNLKLLAAQTFSVLSSRNAKIADLELIETLTEQGVLNSETLVTGHDRPEYQRSAIVPLRWGSPRILCLDRGLFNVLGPDLKDEAFRAARLWRYQFDPGTDLVVSPFRPESDFVGVNNKVRDLLVGCLSKRIDFVTISPNGNMEKILRLSLSAGRQVRVSDRILNTREFISLGAGKIDT